VLRLEGEEAASANNCGMFRLSLVRRSNFVALIKRDKASCATQQFEIAIRNVTVIPLITARVPYSITWCLGFSKSRLMY
jgi:hypothetical protein